MCFNILLKVTRKHVFFISVGREFHSCARCQSITIDMKSREAKFELYVASKSVATMAQTFLLRLHKVTFNVVDSKQNISTARHGQGSKARKSTFLFANIRTHIYFRKSLAVLDNPP